MLCWLFNTGSTSAAITTRQIWNSTKGSVALIGDSCTRTLEAGKSCEYYTVTGAGTYTCRAITNGVDNDVVGMMQLYNSGDGLLVTLPMAK